MLYTGYSRPATLFRYGLIGFDIFTILFFVLTVPQELTPGILAADLAIGFLILCDLLARLWISASKRRMLAQVYTIADILVIASLLLAPLIDHNLAFLRVLRAFRLLHSYHVLRDLRRETSLFRHNEDTIVAAINLGVFVFLVSALVFVLERGRNPDVDGFVAALYFTVATLTTTGFGDIVLTGTLGRLLAVFIMIFGVALFLRLAQTIFRPQKLRYSCPSCGLNRHEVDAVHCKHCGETIRIETEGGG